MAVGRTGGKNVYSDHSPPSKNPKERCVSLRREVRAWYEGLSPTSKNSSLKGNPHNGCSMVKPKEILNPRPPSAAM